MKILIIDYHGERRRRIVSRLRNIDPEGRYVKAITEQEDVKENDRFINTVDYDMVLLHGGLNQPHHVGEFFDTKCSSIPTVLYTGGSEADFDNFKNENPEIHMKITRLRDGDEKWFNLEELIRGNFLKRKTRKE